MPEPTRIHSPDPDIEIHCWPPRGRSMGAGSEIDHPNGVLVLHKPSGLAVVCTSERGQYKNRRKAEERLRSALDELDRPLRQWIGSAP